MGNWEEMTNISVDKVGRFFRDPKYTGPRYGGENLRYISVYHCYYHLFLAFKKLKSQLKLIFCK